MPESLSPKGKSLSFYGSGLTGALGLRIGKFMIEGLGPQGFNGFRFWF